MDSWMESPIVSFGRDGETFTLGRGTDDPVLHLHGSTGLGLAPVSIASSERITGDGNIVRGVRYGAREVYIPLLMEAESVGALSLMRRELTRLLAPHQGPVEIRVQDPATGTDRMVRGYLREGLDGDFGDGFYGSWQTLGLTFECPDPWWLGPERTQTLQINPGAKPFISDTVPFFPVVLAESFAQGEWTITVEGDTDVWPTWEITGPGTDLLIEGPTDRIFIKGEFRADAGATRIDTGSGRISPDRWADVSLDSRLFALRPGNNTISVSLAGATTATTVRLVWRERYLEGI